MQGSIFTSMSGDTAHVTSIYVPWSACGDDLATTSPIGHAHHPNMPALGAQHAQSCSIAPPAMPRGRAPHGRRRYVAMMLRTTASIGAVLGHSAAPTCADKLSRRPARRLSRDHTVMCVPHPSATPLSTHTGRRDAPDVERPIRILAVIDALRAPKDPCDRAVEVAPFCACPNSGAMGGIAYKYP